MKRHYAKQYYKLSNSCFSGVWLVASCNVLCNKNVALSSSQQVETIPAFTEDQTELHTMKIVDEMALW
jgi:hypothetical protein